MHPPQQTKLRANSNRSPSPTRSSHRSRNMGRMRRDARSSSPRFRKDRSRSPSPHRTRREQRTSRKPLTACAICLGRHPHKISECRAVTLWDGGPSALTGSALVDATTGITLSGMNAQAVALPNTGPNNALSHNLHNLLIRRNAALTPYIPDHWYI
ncbi:hypothetical protein JOM56_002765 [Amanita muscaria]